MVSGRQGRGLAYGRALWKLAVALGICVGGNGSRQAVAGLPATASMQPGEQRCNVWATPAPAKCLCPGRLSKVPLDTYVDLQLGAASSYPGSGREMALVNTDECAVCQRLLRRVCTLVSPTPLTALSASLQTYA